jgi:hypothetical protein
MPAPSHAELLALWERAREQGLAQRALTLLGAVSPQSSLDELHAMPVGERDSRLLRLREQLFGPALQSVATCPACHTRLEFTLQAGALAGATLPAEPPRLTVGDMELRLRSVSSGDLIAVAHCQSVAEARRLLCERCVVDMRRGAVSASFSDLTDEAVERISAVLATADPRAELLIDVGCESCSHRWQVVLDVVSFLWAEVDALARRLLNEVHALAWAYGWREADILGMSDARRRFYLDRVSG